MTPRARRRLVLRFQLPPLFERLIYYLMLPDLFSRVVLEAGAGIYWYSITQPKQWVFYLLVMVEYVFQARSFLHAKYYKSHNLLVVLLLVAMLLHGIFVGILWHNHIPKILTDSIPVFVMIGNVILLSKTDAFTGFDFARLQRFGEIYGLTMVIVGALAVAAGRPSIVNLGGSAGGSLCLSIILVGMMMRPRISLRDVLVLGLIMLPALPNLTRTTTVVFGLAFIFFVMPKVLRSGWAVYATLVGFVAIIVAFPLLVPEDSPLMRRIQGTLQLAESDSASTSDSGSIGEREAEVKAIDVAERDRGLTAELFGLGAGGTYYVEFTGGRVPDNYSHAHFSWALFKLRYGYVGYFYLAVFVVFLLWNLRGTLRSKLPENRIIFVLGLWGFFFLFSYMFYNQLIAGLQFAKRQGRVAGED